MSAGPRRASWAACCAGAVYSLLLEESWDDLTGLTSGLSEEKLGFLCPAACRKTVLENWLVVLRAPRGRSSSVLGVIRKFEFFFFVVVVVLCVCVSFFEVVFLPLKGKTRECWLPVLSTFE